MGVDAMKSIGHYKSIGRFEMEMTQKHQFKMNLPDDVKGWVEAEAAKNCRSKSAQIVFALRSVAAAGGSFGDQAPAAEVESAA